jgi:hypothetical protein
MRSLQHPLNTRDASHIEPLGDIPEHGDTVRVHPRPRFAMIEQQRRTG